MFDGLGEAIAFGFQFLAFFAIWGMMTFLGCIGAGAAWIFIDSGAWIAWTIGGFSTVGFVMACILPRIWFR